MHYEANVSMFTYATEVLHLSEHEAYLRIAAARVARKYPMLLVMLGDGRLHLSGIGKLALRRRSSPMRTARRFSLAQPTSRNAKSRNWWPSWRPSRMCRRACASSPHGPRTFTEGRVSNSVQTK